MSALQNQSVNLISSLSGINREVNLKTDKSASSKSIEPRKIEFIPINTSLEERLWNNCAALKIIASKYSVSHIDPIVRKQLFFQIDWLLNSEEWEESDSFANEESFKTLIKVILNSNPFKAPYLGLSDSGNLLASWINESNELELECLPNDCTRWFISCVFDGKKERVCGESPSLERLLASLTPYKNAGWFKP